MPRRPLSLLPLALLWALAQPAAAQSLDPVVVSAPAGPQRVWGAPYAVSVVDADTLQRAGPLVHLSEALQRVPGLVVANRQNLAQDLQISSRGFGARAGFGVRGLRLYTDGIPAGGPDGQGQVSHFDLAGAAQVEVLRGPFSALYGTASGGVIALVSRAPTEAHTQLALDLGSDALRQWRLRLEQPLQDGWSLRATLAALHSDGARPHSAAQRRLAHLRLGREHAEGRWVLHLSHLDQPAQDPLGLTRAQLDADPAQPAPQAIQFNTRKTLAQTQAGLQGLLPLGEHAQLQLSAYAGRRAVAQWLAIPVATQAPARHPGGVIDFARQYRGLDARWIGEAWGARWVLGAALDTQQEARRGFENFANGQTGELGVRGALRRDERNHVEGRDVFAQADWPWGEAWQASLGLRHSRLALRTQDRFLSNGDDSGRLGFSAWTPVAALRWQPGPAWSLHASLARGAETPTLGELAYRPDGQPGFNTQLAAQTSRQAELGLKWRGAAAGLQLALFRADTRAEIGVQSNAGGRATFRNLGPTRRQGLELEGDWRAAPGWRLSASATLLSARVRAPFLACAGTPCTQPSLPVPAGVRVAGTLPRAAFVSLAHETPAWHAALELRGQGRQPVNDANSGFAAGHGLVALRVGGRLGPLETLMRLDNLLDRRGVGSVIVGEGNQRFYEPGAGRSLLLSLRWAL